MKRYGVKEKKGRRREDDTVTGDDGSGNEETDPRDDPLLSVQSLYVVLCEQKARVMHVHHLPYHPLPSITHLFYQL